MAAARSLRPVVRAIAERDPALGAALEERLSARGDPPLVGDLALSGTVVSSHVTVGEGAELHVEGARLWLPGWLPISLGRTVVRVETQRGPPPERTLECAPPRTTTSN